MHPAARAARENLRKFACLNSDGETLVVGQNQKRQRYAETAARQAEEEAESVRAESAAAQSELRKATARAASLATARIAADEKARKLREAADRLAAPKSD